MDNATAAFLGFRPKDNAEHFAAEILAASARLDPQDPGVMCHGGPYASIPLGESALTAMNIPNDAKKM